jgi:hypothetical protein
VAAAGGAVGESIIHSRRLRVAATVCVLGALLSARPGRRRAFRMAGIGVRGAAGDDRGWASVGWSRSLGGILLVLGLAPEVSIVAAREMAPAGAGVMGGWTRASGRFGDARFASVLAVQSETVDPHAVEAPAGAL